MRHVNVDLLFEFESNLEKRGFDADQMKDFENVFIGLLAESVHAEVWLKALSAAEAVMLRSYGRESTSEVGAS